MDLPIGGREHTEDTVEAVETVEAIQTVDTVKAVQTVDTVEAVDAVETVDIIPVLTLFSVRRELLPDHRDPGQVETKGRGRGRVPLFRNTYQDRGIDYVRRV